MNDEYKDRVLGLLEENPDGLSLRQICEKLISRYSVKKINTEGFSNNIRAILIRLKKGRKIDLSDEENPEGRGFIYKRKD